MYVQVPLNFFCMFVLLRVGINITGKVYCVLQIIRVLQTMRIDVCTESTR